MATMTIRQALQQVADYPRPLTDDLTIMPVHELIARALYDIANTPDQSVRGSMTRATRARKLILDRMAGKRRTGTKPVVPSTDMLEFVDLTGGEISGDPEARSTEPAEGVQRSAGQALPDRTTE